MSSIGRGRPWRPDEPGVRPASPLRRRRVGPASGRLRETGGARHTGLFAQARGQQARVEALLASLYVDRAARERWLADPDGEGRRAGLDEAARDAVRTLDRPGLELAAASFAHKRRGRRS